VLEGGVEFQEIPGLGVGGGPVLAENAGANSTLILKLTQALLDGYADVAPRAGGAVAVYQFHDRGAPLTSTGEFPVELSECIAHQRHAGLEVDGRDSLRAAGFWARSHTKGMALACVKDGGAERFPSPLRGSIRVLPR
jgi:hypothetical protein